MFMLRILLILVVFSCQSLSDSSIEWTAELKKFEKGKVVLINSFSSKVIDEFIFDYKAFSSQCFYREEDIPNGIELKNVDEIGFKYNQVVIENEAGDKRLFSRFYAEPKEVKDIESGGGCMFDWTEKVKLSELPVKIEVEIYYLSDLKVKEDDKKVRLHYIWRYGKDEKRLDHPGMLITSNWIDLKL